MQGALPPAPPASPRNSRGATPCQAINFDIFRHIERECSQGFKGGDFRRKYYPSLDGTERHTSLAEGKATRLSLLPHGECGVWGNAPRVKFRDGVRPPFSKGEEDWGLPSASEYRSRSAGGKAPFNGFNIADFSELTRSEITQIKKTLQALIRQYDIVEYAQLMDFLQDEEMNVEYEVASNNTLFFYRYIGSRRHAPRVPKCDPETGEVIEKKES